MSERTDALKAQIIGADLISARIQLLDTLIAVVREEDAKIADNSPAWGDPAFTEAEFYMQDGSHMAGRAIRDQA